MEIVKNKWHLKYIASSQPGTRTLRVKYEHSLNPAIKRGIIYFAGAVAGAVAAAAGAAAVLGPIIFGARSGETTLPPASKPQGQ